MSAPIKVTNLSKRFMRRHKQCPATLKESLVRGKYKFTSNEVFTALDNIDLEVNRGEIVGAIGRNGAGKSTLLRLIGGVGLPDSGDISVHGRMGALLELGAGFHPELTGRENVYINGVISGLTRAEVSERFDDIVAFSELEDSIDNPLRTYSSGMQLRLAFSVSVHTDPDVLLIDEVLAVGDLAFQKKCLDRIEHFKQLGCAILIVSHDIDQIRTVCDRVIWLQNGKISAAGDPQTVTQHYENSMAEETERRRTIELGNKPDTLPAETVEQGRQGTMELQIADIRLEDGDGNPLTEVPRDTPLVVKFGLTSARRIVAPILSVSISDSSGRILLDTNTEELAVPDIEQTGAIQVRIERLEIPQGNYYLDLGAYEKDWVCVYDYHWHMHPLRIIDADGERSTHIPPRWEFTADAS